MPPFRAIDRTLAALWFAAMAGWGVVAVCCVVADFFPGWLAAMLTAGACGGNGWLALCRLRSPDWGLLVPDEEPGNWRVSGGQR